MFHPTNTPSTLVRHLVAPGSASLLALLAALCLHHPVVRAADPISATVDQTTESDRRAIPEIKWDTTLSKFRFDAEKFIGQRLTVICPPAPVNQTLDGVHGTDDYPSESPICIAALHAGVITKDGGMVTIQLNPGLTEYLGSERHGVVTGNLPATKRSLSFITDATKEKNDRIQIKHLPRLSWDTKFTSTGLAYRDLVWQRFRFRVAPAPLDKKMRLVFGTDDYDFSSNVAVAARHAGVITRAGGIVTVQMDGGVSRLVGSIRNGVETKSRNGRDRSISFVEPSDSSASSR